jgi:hypothetical protein
LTSENREVSFEVFDELELGVEKIILMILGEILEGMWRLFGEFI